MNAPLPPCRLCHIEPLVEVYRESVDVFCPPDPTGAGWADHCIAVFGHTREEAETTWRRLASPLAPEIVAVLEACETWHETISGDGTADGDLDDAILDWISEGRPGLPPRAGAGREGE